MKNSQIEDRITRLRETMAQEGMDTILIFSDANRRYLSGYTGEDGSFDESAGVLIITANQLILATDARYDTQAANEAPLYQIHCYKDPMTKEMPALLQQVNANKTGLETARLTCQIYEKLKAEISKAELAVQFFPADTFLKPFRSRKDPQEMTTIRQALSLAEDAFQNFRKSLYPGMTEKEAAWNLEKQFRESGADSLSFPVIAAFGKNSALPHAIPGNKKLVPGEPLLFDFGVRLNGYCSDTTRTLILGKPDQTFKEAYDILNDAQQMAIEAIKPGVKASNIDAVARDYIDATRFKGTFGHSLGHGVGIAIHEAPRLAKTDDTLLEQGMVVTVEPGIYLPEWGGIRLENMVLVTDSGVKVLNRLSYDDFCL